MTETAAPAIGFSVSVQIDEKRSIVAQTHVAQDAPLEDINKLLDKVHAAINRQDTIRKLDEFRRKLEADEVMLLRSTGDLKALDEKHQADWDNGARKGDFKLSKNEEAQRGNALQTIARVQDEIERDKAKIAKFEALLGNGA